MGRGRPGLAVTWSAVGGRLCVECGVRGVWPYRAGDVTARSLSAPRRHHIPRTLHSTINRFTVLLYFHRITRTERLRPHSRTGNVVVPASTALSDYKFKFKNVITVILLYKERIPLAIRAIINDTL